MTFSRLHNLPFLILEHVFQILYTVLLDFKGGVAHSMLFQNKSHKNYPDAVTTEDHTIVF